MFNSEKLNIGNGSQIKIKDLVELFYSKLNPETKIEFNNKVRKGDPNYWEADISLIKGLGYKQKTIISEGVENYIKWLNEKI